MSENKTKLSFRPGVIAGEKSPPPTGLLINHGKPNFTISRTIKKTNVVSSNDSKSEHFGTMNRRALLKKTPSHEVFKKEEDEERTETLNRRTLLKKTPSNGVLKKEEDEERTETLNRRILLKKTLSNGVFKKEEDEERTETLNRRTLLKKTPSNGALKKDEDEERIEFLQAHKKISEKIAKESTETREEFRNNISTIRIRPSKEQHFVQIQNGRLHSAAVVSDNLQNEDNLPPKINGYSKPALPEKPATLQNYKPTSPTGLNTSIPEFKKPTVAPSVVSPVQNGVNFEQKTFVSFSKDLSSEPNKYPETVKITKPADNHIEAKDRVIEELTKLKFEIVSNGEVVVPVARNQ